MNRSMANVKLVWFVPLETLAETPAYDLYPLLDP